MPPDTRLRPSPTSFWNPLASLCQQEPLTAPSRLRFPVYGLPALSCGFQARQRGVQTRASDLFPVHRNRSLSPGSAHAVSTLTTALGHRPTSASVVLQ